MDLLARYQWPGNIRQLANVLRTAAVMACGEGQITEAHLSDDFLEDARLPPRSPVQQPVPRAGADADAHARRAADGDGAGARGTRACASAAPPANRTLEEVEIDMIRAALDAAGGNISEASKRLGISRNTIYRKLRWNKAA